MRAVRVKRHVADFWGTPVPPERPRQRRKQITTRVVAVSSSIVCFCERERDAYYTRLRGRLSGERKCENQVCRRKVKGMLPNVVSRTARWVFKAGSMGMLIPPLVSRVAYSPSSSRRSYKKSSRRSVPVKEEAKHCLVVSAYDPQGRSALVSHLRGPSCIPSSILHPAVSSTPWSFTRALRRMTAAPRCNLANSNSVLLLGLANLPGKSLLWLLI
jgi:hypothetical protein